jgi:glycosyltransferase involved in cell wall biosynthesis
MKVLVFPRCKTEPHQDLLYGAMRELGVSVTYVAEPTRSQTINLLLLPALLAQARASRHRILHIHWVYPFAPSWVSRMPGGRWLMQLWYRIFLGTARLLGFRIIWTAHNLLPHDRVFPDDRAARYHLVRSSAAVIALSRASVPELEAFGARRVVHVPFGRYTDLLAHSITASRARSVLAIPEGSRVAAFVGNIEPYKGVDLLLDAFCRVDANLPLQLVVAGRCADPRLEARLRALAADAPGRVLLRLEWIPDQELEVYYTAADIIVLPFRSITNSGSLLLALEFAKPILIPDLPELADFEPTVALRYRAGSVASLANALVTAVEMPAEALVEMGKAALASADERSWEAAAAATAAVYGEVLASSEPLGRNRYRRRVRPHRVESK